MNVCFWEWLLSLPGLYLGQIRVLNSGSREPANRNHKRRGGGLSREVKKHMVDAYYYYDVADPPNFTFIPVAWCIPEKTRMLGFLSCKVSVLFCMHAMIKFWHLCGITAEMFLEFLQST